MPADSFCPPSYLYARHSLLTFILFMCPPFCLHARRFVLPVIFSTPVILFTHPLTHFSRQTKYARGFVYMPAESSISARRLVYMPAILIYASSCLCARGSVYTRLVYMPAVLSTRVLFTCPADSFCPPFFLYARRFVYTPARAHHLLYTPAIAIYLSSCLYARGSVYTPADSFCAPRIYAPYSIHMPTDSFCPPRCPSPLFYLHAHHAVTCPPFRSTRHLVFSFTCPPVFLSVIDTLGHARRLICPA